MLRGACVLLAALVLCPSSLRAQGALQRLRDAAHYHGGGSSGSSSSSNDTNSSSNWASGATGEGLGAALVGAGIIATSPFWVPHEMLHDDLGEGYFPAYPYASSISAYVQRDPWQRDSTRPEDPDYGRPWSLRAAVEDGNDFRGLNRFNGRVEFDTCWRVGVQSNWSYFTECLDGGRSDSLVMGDTNLVYRFAQCEWMQMHSGVGLRVETDSSETRFGFNFTYGADFFPVQPVIVSTVIDLGNLDSAFVVHGRATVGAVFQHWELFGGYDFLRVGGVNLQGPMLGVRAWF
jgi:hypothetical protein